MFQRKPRRFSNRRRPNGRGHMSRGNGHSHARLGPGAFSNNSNRNNFRSTQSAEKLFEKYNTMAKEAMSSGDKTACENYLQHADHFARIIQDKNKNKIPSAVAPANQTIVDNKNSYESSTEVKTEDSIKKQ